MHPARSYSPRFIHAGHLRGLAADERTAAGATRLGEAAQDLREDRGLELFRADVIEKKQRPRAEHGDVVDAVVDQIGADGVVAVEGEGDLQFRPDAIDAADQHRLAEPAKIRREKSAEPADFPEHFRSMRLPDESVNSALQPVPEIDVDPGAGIGFFLRRHEDGAATVPFRAREVPHFPGNDKAENPAEIAAR